MQLGYNLSVEEASGDGMRLWLAEGGWVRVPYCRLDDLNQQRSRVDGHVDQDVRCEVLVDLEEDSCPKEIGLESAGGGVNVSSANVFDSLSDSLSKNGIEAAVPCNGDVTTFDPIHRLSFFKGPRSRIKYILDVSIHLTAGRYILQQSPPPSFILVRVESAFSLIVRFLSCFAKCSKCTS